MGTASTLGRLAAAHWREFSLRRVFCPRCDRRRWWVRLAPHEAWVRCLGCRASAVTLSLILALRRECASELQGDVYELSARGTLFDFLRSSAGGLTGSEYDPSRPSGQVVDGIRCEDVQALSFPDRSFDLVTSTEVFEHVPDDRRGFHEVLRVLKPGGKFLFTVPLSGQEHTVTRARLGEDGRICHLEAPSYHQDPSRGGCEVLVFRDYGRDIVGRLLESGFSEARILPAPGAFPWSYGREVVLARTPALAQNSGSRI